MTAGIRNCPAVLTELGSRFITSLFLYLASVQFQTQAGSLYLVLGIAKYDRLFFQLNTELTFHGFLYFYS